MLFMFSTYIVGIYSVCPPPSLVGAYKLHHLRRLCHIFYIGNYYVMACGLKLGVHNVMCAVAQAEKNP